MNFQLVGISHKTAPVSIRERIALAEEELPDALRAAVSIPGVQEALILSTCNRVEILTRVESAEAEGNSGLLLARFLADYRRLPVSTLEPYLYHRQQRDAIHHIFRVASSLDSMIVGETQILGQVKAAYAIARSVGTIKGPLDEVLTRAFFVAKRVRSETAISSSAVSVSYAAVELAKKIFGSLEGRPILLVGAGKMSELAAKHLSSNGGSQVLVTNRTPEKAEEMARALNGRAVPYQQLFEYAAQCDIIIASTAAPHYILHKTDAQRLLAQRRNRPIFFVDISVPRNIDPEINRLDNAYLYDIDDLQQVVNANLKERMREAQLAEQIAEEEVEKFIRRIKTLDVVPTIIDLQAQMEELRKQELARIQSQMGDLTPQQRAALEAFSKGLVNKMLHPPITHLKTLAQQPDGLKLVETVRRIFNLKQ